MYHSVTLAGNLGGDPEMRYTPSGKAVTNFSVATSENWTGQDGEKHSKTIWWRVATWGKQAEVMNQYLKKGSKVLVVGTMNADDRGNPRTFDGKNGAQASYELTASTVKFLDSKGQTSESHSSDDDDGGIPF